MTRRQAPRTYTDDCKSLVAKWIHSLKPACCARIYELPAVSCIFETFFTALKQKNTLENKSICTTKKKYLQVCHGEQLPRNRDRTQIPTPLFLQTYQTLFNEQQPKEFQLKTSAIDIVPHLHSKYKAGNLSFELFLPHLLCNKAVLQPVACQWRGER